ncbi:hypothetical protein [Arthrobacter sp. VKM Ac-2550]|uniref:hypothetical protein n=1 Tax=Crystallibacter permensis TaxID=1938888 RepID=UPI002227BBD5|nr:hypothetical protein [Arthrobacter sp. VKM Ac-2550]
MSAQGGPLLYRLRRMPGLIGAAVMFCLVVLMGLGGTSAVAKWSQSATVGIEIVAESWSPTCTVSTDGTTFTIQWAQVPGIEYVLEAVWMNGEGHAPPGQQKPFDFVPIDSGTGLMTLQLTQSDLDLKSGWRVRVTGGSAGEEIFVFNLTQSGGTGTCA